MININLLPQEFTFERSKKVRFFKIQALGVAILLFFIFLSSLTVALRILQSRNIDLVRTKLSAVEQRITSEIDKQGSVLLVKDRLNTINQFLGVSSEQASIYKLITSLIPAGVLVSNMSIDKNSDVTLQITVPDANSLDNLISSLLNTEKNEGKITKIDVENLSRAQGGIYRVGLKVK
ncbi:hypothetical protein HYS94_02590 [Candidatus Daviesbacteria bacterium]|nr:hypothetical protein [Candidatus Daviesbacteria bacterium]